VELFEDDGEPGSARWVKRTQLRLRILNDHHRRGAFDELLDQVEAEGWTYDLATRTLQPLASGAVSPPQAAPDQRRPDGAVQETLRSSAQAFDGARGAWAYAAFDLLNSRYFQGELVTPVIRWGLTPYGRCFGQARSASHPPTILLHPALLGRPRPRPSKPPWGLNPAWLGEAFSFDVLLHESIHQSQHQRLGGVSGSTAHNDPNWISEVNRLLPWLGFSGLVAGQSRTIRVPIEGELTKRGKRPTQVVRRSGGNLPHWVVARFPHGVRHWLGTTDSYYREPLPPAWGLPTFPSPL
jgi:hypothetical protein